MAAFTRRAVRLIAAAALGAAVFLPWVDAPGSVDYLANCPNGMVPNPGGYGCVPYRPGTGAPTQEVLTRCHGNYYLCVWPYPTP
ncbi:MAG: hypothetical protein QOH57_33 [Mycobacterium sp.]|nr:hypothetical protein [Mycobacterium sp.]